MIEIILGIAATSTVAIVAWTGKRLVTKVDRIDVVVRGDGNGSPGLGERIRDVHQDVKSVGKSLAAHLRESEAWQDRIVQCENQHESDEGA